MINSDMENVAASPATRQEAFRTQYPLIDLNPQPNVLWANPQAPEPALEHYRILRAKILHHAYAPRVILVGSPCPEDGKSTTAVNLAGMLAFRHRVVLVDCDLRRSSMARTLGLGHQPGMFAYLTGSPLENSIVCARSLPNLAILPAGRATVNPAELMDIPAWDTLMTRLRSEFEYVICDGPPISGLADYSLLERMADASMLVVRANHTDRSAMDSALECVDPDKFLGLVLNQSEDWFLWKSRSNYGYYGYSNSQEAIRERNER